jgi:hypothetical protein
MKSYKNLLHVLTKDKEIILLDPLSKDDDASRVSRFLQLIKTEEYFEFPIHENSAKYMRIDKNTNFFELYESLLSQKRSDFQDSLLLIITLILTHHNDYFDISYNEAIKNIRESYKNSNGTEVAEKYSDIIKYIASIISRKIKENDFTNQVDTGDKKIRKNDINYKMEDLSILASFLMDYKNSLGYGYWNKPVDFQSLISYVIFNDYKNSQDILIKAFTRRVSEYKIYEAPANYILSLEDSDLREFAILHKKYKAEINSLVILEVLRRKIFTYDELEEKTGSRHSLRGIYSYFSDNKSINPLDYKDELLEIAFKDSGNRSWDNDPKYKIELATRNLFGISRELLGEYYIKYEAEIKEVYKEYNLPFEIIVLNNYFENTNPSYDEILFYNDINMMRNGKVGSREWNFALMINTIFRMDKVSRKYVSDEIVQDIITKGVEAFIGSSDTYSLRNRMARTMASFIHEKNTDRNKKYDIPREKDIRYLIETFSNSKLRATFFAKIFNMPQQLESNYYEIRNNMEKDSFFRRSYAEFVNMIDDIDYSEELDSVILLLALS